MNVFQFMEFIGYSLAIISAGFKLGILYAHMSQQDQNSI